MRGVRDAGVRRIAVFFGGADENDLTGRTLTRRGARRRCVRSRSTSSPAPRTPGRRSSRRRASASVQVHVDTPRVAEIFAAADLAVGAAGTASWERAWLGLPALVVAVAENQREVARGLAAAGAARDSAGTSRSPRPRSKRRCSTPSPIRARCGRCRVARSR